MIPRILIDTATIPGSPEQLRLFQRNLKNGPEFSIMLGNNELMNSRLSGSEEALATLPSARLDTCKAPRVLIGGLGMGFTLRAILPLLGPEAAIVVAELVPAVIDWARGPMQALYGDSLDDPRTQIVTGDVFDLITGDSNAYDAILLDVDNGPDGLTHAANDRLYGQAGLRQAHRNLRSGGILAVWSSAPDDRFTNRLQACGYQVDVVPVRAHRDRGAHHVIWLATKV